MTQEEKIMQEADRIYLYLSQNFEPKVMVFHFMKNQIVYSEN